MNHDSPDNPRQLLVWAGALQLLLVPLLLLSAMMAFEVSKVLPFAIAACAVAWGVTSLSVIRRRHWAVWASILLEAPLAAVSTAVALANARDVATSDSSAFWTGTVTALFCGASLALLVRGRAATLR